MKLLQYFQYVYLIFAVVFIWDAISNWAVDRNRAYMSLFFSALGVFMFFFRRRFAKKFQDRQKP